MSKLLELLEARETGRVLPDLQPINSICAIDEGCSTTYTHDKEYSIRITFGSLVRLTDNIATGHPQSLDYAKKQVRQSIIEAVFGEFRPDLIKAREMLWNRDYENASIALDNLERKMFS